jgi:hypothetical protein
VSERSVKRGVVPGSRGLRGAKTRPLCGRWRHGVTLKRPTVASGAGQMYALERRQSGKWKFRLIGLAASISQANARI